MISPPIDPLLETQEAMAALLREGLLSRDEAHAANYTWELFARAEQLPPPGEWRSWLILGGRGSGKTRPAAEWTRNFVTRHPGCSDGSAR